MSSRSARQAEIDAMIAEMMGSAPAVRRHPDVPVAPAAGQGGEDVGEGGAEVVDEEEDLPSEDEEDGGSESVHGNAPSAPQSYSGARVAASSSSSSSGRTIPQQEEEVVGSNPTDAHVSEAQDASETNTIDAFALEHKIPISHQVSLGGHAKAVTCLSIEPAGNRVVTGSLDYMIKIYDFGGMDSRHRAFRSAEADEGHPIKSICHSSTGDKYIIGTGSTQPRVFDRDGQELIKFCRGDMYLRDLSNTKGHTMEVCCVRWHPTEKNVVMTSSLDGSVRLWDLLGEAAFGNLVNKHVLKIRGLTGQSRVGATSCCFSPDGSKIVAGASDGSVQIWHNRKVFSRPDIVLRTSPTASPAITCVAMTTARPNIIASRAEDGTVAVWDLGNTKTPFIVFRDIPNIYENANVEFSPDGSMIVCGTSVRKGDKTEKAHLLFFDISSASTSPEPCLRVGLAPGASAICVQWQAKTNQIFCSMSNGETIVLYDPRFSTKGAVLTAGRAARREKDPSDFAVEPQIYNPHALKMFRVNPMDERRQKALDRKDPMKSKIPEKPVLSKNAGNTSFFFTKYVMEGREKRVLNEDPREALLKMNSAAQSDPIFFGPAYAKSQPQTQLHDRTFEQEHEEFNTKKRKL